ncbi:endopeptidase La [Gottschalkiaceae bacterium SANA]|nr:endopeptidase La [Gottschalkiaceae bacterium SANA]
MTKYTIEQTQQILPLIPLRGLTVFPYMVMHFDVGRDKSVAALEEAMVKDSHIFLTSQKDLKIEDPTPDDYFKVGTICKVKQMLKLPGDVIRVLVEGINRAQIREITSTEPYFEVEVEEFLYEYEGQLDENKEIVAAVRMVHKNFEQYVKVSDRISSEALLSVSEILEPGRLADTIASYIRLSQERKQEILELFQPIERLIRLDAMIKEEIELLEIEEELSEKVKSQINQVQKEYYLKEQLRAIQEELGQEDDPTSDLMEYEVRLQNKKMPQEARDKAMKEMKRLRTLHPSSAETGVIRNYIEWILDLPWSKKSRDRKDLSYARQVLDEDHYGLEDVKERIIEFLAVRKMASKTMKAPIICLVGPPGVGKTSIAKSVARSLNRKFVRMSLGGVRDEAEIRGHRRTYVGALPGNIITNMKKVGVTNPVFLFDEIDKLASDFRGDPASALLEVLDPEQNNTFTDHFMELPYDLSNVMFITTANTVSTIPGPLRDRMEIIEISSYTENEKYEIAKRYLVPKQLGQHGLKDSQLKFSPAALKEVISGYTREAGVRNLERQIANICRKVVTILQEDPKGFTDMHVNKSNLTRFLGPQRFMYDKVEKEDQIGLATGLAWTSVGGVTLFIEVSVMPGKGKIQLTGKLGDVMKESALTGMSYIRTIADTICLEPDFHEKYDVHIHIPEGATPKDGPSAGITMVTAVTSALCKRPVRGDIAMTGEVTLRGRVLPIGGLKEKTLAAHRAGIRTLIIPFDNKKDVEKIPEKVREQMKFIFAKTMDEVLKHALV